MIVAIAALENGIVDPGWRVQCGGSFRFGNKVFKDEHVHGSVDMIQAIQKSCNVYFYQLMLRTGLDAWAHYGAEFGFGQLTGIDITEESAGLLPTTAWMDRRYGKKGWTRGFLVSLGIGQGELGVTPVQMAGYAAQLATRGTRFQPHAVRTMADRLGMAPDTIRGERYRTELRPRTWDVVREGMRRVVQEPGGTASLARVAGVQAAGKTGTAQNPHGKSHAWFIGFAPFEEPRIAIAVLVENVGYGGSYAAPIAGLCFEQYLKGRLVRFDRPAAPPVAAGPSDRPPLSVLAGEGTAR
jgi:penicillin-binding protein 2